VAAVALNQPNGWDGLNAQQSSAIVTVFTHFFLDVSGSRTIFYGELPASAIE
jgi:hypothetical protein